MYMKCLAPQEAFNLFKRMPKNDVVSWAALLSGYAQNGMANKSMGVFRSMLSDETQPDAVAMVRLLAACSEVGILQQALCLHAYVIKREHFSLFYLLVAIQVWLKKVSRYSI